MSVKTEDWGVYFSVLVRLNMVYLYFSLHCFQKSLISFPANLIIHHGFAVIFILHLLKIINFSCHDLQICISIQSFNKYLSRIYYGWSHVLSTWQHKGETSFALWGIKVYVKAQILKQIHMLKGLSVWSLQSSVLHLLAVRHWPNA